MNQPFPYKTKIFTTFFFVFMSLCAWTQYSSKTLQQFDKALHYYKIQEFENAVLTIEKILKKNPDFLDAILLLADVYNGTGETALEIKNLETALRYSNNSLIYLRLGKAYFSIAEYENARIHFGTYLGFQNISEERQNEVERYILHCEFAFEALKNPVDFNAERLPETINTINDEYWPSISLDGSKLVFTRLLKPDRGLPNEDFFISEFDSSGWKQANPIIEVNTPENEGAQALSADGRLLFFTACNRPDGRGSCDIYYSVFNGRFWSKPINAGIILNSISWDAQPSVSSDNRFLYFSSNRDGGMGNKDIWRAEILEIMQNGKIRWGIPENIGEDINTTGDEISPFIHPDNKSFYFASDFHPGMGGFDLFLSRINSKGNFNIPENLGFPINTVKNEQGLNISSDGLSAYYASERNPDTGLDIYTFPLHEEIRPEPVTYLKARISDAETEQIIQAEIELVNLSSDIAIQRMIHADKNGEILLCLPLNANYAFNVSHEGYLFYSESIQLEKKSTIENPGLVEIRLNKIDIGAEMNLYNIYFETDSFRILPVSEPELKKLVVFLKNNPKIEIEIQGHTDNTGRSENNMILSENRAKSVADYLIKNGIQDNRLQFKGFGETKPVASNNSEEGKMLNRRTTIKIAKN